MTKAPNILWIVTTQWRARSCGYAGDPNVRTPRLDALAAESVNYAQAVTPHPFGPFARAAMLTGVPSPDNGVRDYFDPLSEGAATIAHGLRARGYTTAFFGKWHLGRRDPGMPLVGAAHARTIVPPEARGGFDWWEGFESGFLLNDPFLHGTRLPEPKQFFGYQSDVLCDRAGEWLRRDGPWFAMVSLEPPHPPYEAPSADVQPQPVDAIMLPINVPPGTPAATRARRDLAGYHAHIEATDRAIGRLITALPRDTTIVVTSVHGDMHGAHGLFRKGWPYEESVRVPLLVRVPGVVPRRDDTAIPLLDLPAMTLAWVDRAPPLSTPDRSRISMPSIVALPDQCDRIWRGVRTATRKLVLNADGTPWLYFDLKQDPGEMHNLAADPARAAEICALRDTG